MTARRVFALGILVSATVALSASARAKDPVFDHVPLKKIAQATSGDPLDIWSDRDFAAVVAGAPNIFAGTYHTDRGTIIVSQLVGRGLCDTPSDCPVRVVLQDPSGKRRVLIESEQLCASPNFFAVRRDLKALRACDRVVDLP
jgi:hypothetical protein